MCVKRKKLNIIVAAQRIKNGVEHLAIGNKNGLPWKKSKTDMQWFKETTWGNIVIMGNRTFESIGGPLPYRYNIVITSEPFDTVVSVNSVLASAKDFRDAVIKANAVNDGLLKENHEIFVIGGGRVYEDALNSDLVDEIYIDLMQGRCEEYDTKITNFLMGDRSMSWDCVFMHKMDTDGIDIRYILKRIDRKVNEFDSSYMNLVTQIIYRGIRKHSRAGDTLSVFGTNMVVDLKEGLPMLTTKKMFAKGCIHELLWFLKGDTNIKYLVDNGVHIWDDDAYRFYREKTGDLELSKEDFINRVMMGEKLGDYTCGDLGPVYGKQWTDWNGVNQVKNIIETLKTNPNDRRLLISAWNVADLDKMALPPCHYSCQFYTRPLTERERMDWCDDNMVAYDSETTPKYGLSCMWNQRSVDVLLGLPFNFLSYAIFTHLIAKCVNMIPDRLIFNGGDTHVYVNQVETYKKEQMDRDPMKYSLPRLELADKTSIEDFTYDDIKIVGYESYPAVKYPLSVGL